MRTASTSLLPWLALGLASCATDYEIIAEPVDVDPAEIAECGFTAIPFTDTGPPSHEAWRPRP